MTDTFNEMLRSWHNFYFMAGGIAATLLGLMFVAISLGMPLIQGEVTEEMKTFVAPSVFYFVSVMILCGVMLAPAYTPSVLALILFSGSLMGLRRTLRAAPGLIRAARKHQDFDLQEWLAQIILPVVAYLMILLTALGFGMEQWSVAFRGLWLATILLIFCAISNTWSLMLWIVDQRDTSN